MIKNVPPLRFAIAVGLVATAAPFASAMSGSAVAQCSQQARTLKAQKVAATDLKTERDALVEEVEAAGEAWDVAEATRLFGDAEAQKADAAKAEYDALKAELISLEAKLQEKVSDLNAGVAAYNEACATN